MEIISLFLYSSYPRRRQRAGACFSGEVFSLAQEVCILPANGRCTARAQCFLLAFVKNLHLNKLTSSTDGAIISYINKTIYHHYIALSKAKRHQLPTVSIESQTDYDPLQFDTAFSESDTYNNLLLLDLKRALSTEEYHCHL